MKRARAALLTVVLLGILAFAAPHTAALQDECTPLRFGTPEAVYSISAVYTVETGQVAEIEVVFADAVKDYAYASFADGELRVAIASASVIDLSRSIGGVTAVLENGSRVAPELTLKSLRFNGKKATCNLVPGDVSAVRENGSIHLSVPIHNDFPCACIVVIAAYDENGRMLAADVLAADGSAVDQILDGTLTGCEGANLVKVFCYAPSYMPLTGVRTAAL